MASTQAAASTTLDTGSLRDSYIPVFSGLPQDYKEWKKRIHMYHRKMVLSKRTQESVLNILGSFQGAAWRLFEDMPMSELEQEGAFEKILKTLDQHYSYDERVQLPSDFEGYFNVLNRKNGQTLLSFVSEHDEALRKLQSHNIDLPKPVQGWHLLRRANLTKEQKQLVTLKAPLMERDQVIEALYLLFGQDYKSGGWHQDRHSDRRFQRYGKSRAYAAQDAVETEELYSDAPEDDDEAYYQDWCDESEFDQDEAYYGDETGETFADSDPSLLAEEFDEAYATYVDARKRFQDLRLSRGFLPIVALADQPSGKGSNATSPSSSPTNRKGKGKSKKGGKSNTVRYPSSPGGKGKGQADPRGRAKAASTCLRCGQQGHWAANCPQPPSRSSGGTKRAAPGTPSSNVTEGMALHDAPDAAMLMFQDVDGHERPDTVMLDPGASAFLAGYHPFKRYVELLRDWGYPVEELEMVRCERRFQFGGDAAAMSRWSVLLPVFLDGRFGKIQMYLLPGHTPMLCGRPIIEALSMSMDFAGRRLKFGASPWFQATIGAHGEYLLSLTQDIENIKYDAKHPDYELRTTDGCEVSSKSFTLDEFNAEEEVFRAEDSNEFEEKPGYGSLKRPVLKTAGVLLETELNQWEAYVTQELHAGLQPRQRVLWEVYSGEGRTSQIAASLGMTVETFSLDTGWDFDDVGHQFAFLEKLEAEMPDEVLISPVCKWWSQMQSLACRTDEQKAMLKWNRQWHHDRHLQFVKKVYMSQVDSGRHAHIEQPRNALSWKTKALKALPGYWADFDQCMYGAQCLDDDGVWRPSQKGTCFLTTKRAVQVALHLRCDRQHEHCKLEGAAPGLGSRTRYMENYQPGFAATLAAVLISPEEAQPWETVMTTSEDKQATGELLRLYSTHPQEIVRIVQRLHRNLGHPSAQSLVNLLQSRGAGEDLIEAAKRYVCLTCSKQKKPNQTAPSSSKQFKEFNAQVQADVFYLKLGDKKIPVMSMVDSATRFIAAALLHQERSEDYIRAIERAWIRHFGIPQVLLTDEGRPWLSDVFGEWTAAHGIMHNVAPGEAHERLALVERRHAVLRRAVEIYMAEFGLDDPTGVKEALAYVVPQQNAIAGASGFSPTQWLLGYQPALAGDLLHDQLNPTHFGGNPAFEELLLKRTAAKKALIEADADSKLRRALLRQYKGTTKEFSLGQRVWFWRDARQPDLVKIRWLGPAFVVMRETDEDGKPRVYWLTYKTQLIRCAPHHVRGDAFGPEHILDDTQSALNYVHQLRSRGVTRYLDLQRVNRSQLLDLDDDEQRDEFDGPLSDDDGPPRQRMRIHPPLPSIDDVAPEDIAADDEYSPEIEVPAISVPGTAQHPQVELERNENQQIAEPTALPRGVSTADTEPHAEPMSSSPQAAEGGGSPSRVLRQLDPETRALYEPEDAEDFHRRRMRFDRQETLQFGPWRRARVDATVAPYEPNVTPATEADAVLDEAFPIEDLDGKMLPAGWHMDEHGYIQMDDTPRDYWEVGAGCLIRHHVVPRRQKLSIANLPKDCPVAAESLDAVRVTVVKEANGKCRVHTDDGSDLISPCDRAWCGATIFQINGATRKELCMYSQGRPLQGAKQTAKDYKHQVARKFKKDKNSINERLLTPDERAQFKEAKMKELRSFFDNHVWVFDSVKNADPQRTLTSRILLKWSKNPDGSPRAKARLIVRGYTDPDALQGKVETSSPTTTRLSRSMLFSLAANLSWPLWTADVSTAFLQGRPQARQLWVKLPSEALALLGADEETRMLLLKPCYGQLDAPRGWYLEAVSRVVRIGLRQHPLDPCCFLIFEEDFPEQMQVQIPDDVLGESRLCGMIIMHVDDMLGAGSTSSPVYQHVVERLKDFAVFHIPAVGTDHQGDDSDSGRLQPIAQVCKGAQRCWIDLWKAWSTGEARSCLLLWCSLCHSWRWRWCFTGWLCVDAHAPWRFEWLCSWRVIPCAWLEEHEDSEGCQKQSWRWSSGWWTGEWRCGLHLQVLAPFVAAKVEVGWVAWSALDPRAHHGDRCKGPLRFLPSWRGKWHCGR